MNRANVCLIAVTGLVAVFTAGLSHAKVYKWTDSNGKVHYSDKPFNQKSQLVEIKPAPSVEQTQQAKKEASKWIQYQNKVQEIADDDAKDKALADRKAKQKKDKLTALCNKGKKEIIQLGRGYRSYTTSADGKRKYLTDDEKTQEIATIKQFTDKNCSD